MIIKVILPAAEIPLDSVVTKRTGEKEYTLRDRVRVFGESGERREIVASGGSRFIVSPNGDANVVNADTELCWLTDREQLLAFLTPLDD